MKTVYALDQNGYLVGTRECQPSPRENGAYLIPPNTIETPPPSTKEGEIARFKDSWTVEIDPRGKTFYNKKDRSEKNFDLGEEVDETYTDIAPIEGELFQLFVDGKWTIDTQSKERNEIQKRINELKGLLTSSDYRMTFDKYNSMTVEDQTHWTNQREEWRIEIRKLESEINQ